MTLKRLICSTRAEPVRWRSTAVHGGPNGARHGGVVGRPSGGGGGDTVERDQLPRSTPSSASPAAAAKAARPYSPASTRPPRRGPQRRLVLMLGDRRGEQLADGRCFRGLHLCHLQVADQELGLVADGVLERLAEVDVEMADG